MDNTLIDHIKREIENFDFEAVPEEAGRVLRVGDGVAEAEGLSEAQLMEMVLFDQTGVEGAPLEESIGKTQDVIGLILNLEEETTKIIILGDQEKVQEGMVVKRTKQLLSVSVAEGIIGRVVNALGEPIDGKGAIENTEKRPIEREAYGVIDRAPVDTPLHTGIKAIDAMIPIGRGQRELIIGDRFTGKTTIGIDTILNQKQEPKESRPICIYVAVGQKEAKTARLVSLLQERGAMEYTTVVSAGASVSSALQYLAPFTGAAIGEYFMDQGRDVLVIYDDLSKQAQAYREVSLLLRRPPGREAYPGDIFYLHSRLLERAAKLSEEKGGGSLTALPIIETQEGDVSAYIPTNVISITDGQIFLDTNLFNKGTKPAIEVGISVSRVGSSAQTKAMKKVAGTLRLELAQFRELEAFMQFAQDLDEATKQRIERGRRLSEVLNQKQYSPVPFERQVAVIFAATSETFGDVPPERMRDAELAFISFMDTQRNDLLDTIKTEKALSDETAQKLQEAITQFKNAHPEYFLEKQRTE